MNDLSREVIHVIQTDIPQCMLAEQEDVFRARMNFKVMVVDKITEQLLAAIREIAVKHKIDTTYIIDEEALVDMLKMWNTGKEVSE